MKQKGFAGLLILVGIAIFILIGGVVVYQKVFAPKVNPTPTPITSPPPILTPPITTAPSSISQPSPTPDLTADWKTYTNNTMGFQIKYPIDKKFEISGNQKTIVFIMMPSSDYGIVFGLNENPQSLSAINWLKLQGLEQTRINDKPLQFSDLEVENITVGGQQGIRVSGPIPSQIFVSIPSNKKILKIAGSTLEENLLDQILSTFKFLN